MRNYLLLFLIVIFFAYPKNVFAQIIFNDDFSNDLNKWTLVSGEMSYWQIKNQSLYGYIFPPQHESVLVPKDELWQGMTEYTVDFIFKAFDGADKNFVVGMRNSANFYDFHFYNNQLIVEDIRDSFSLQRMSVPFILQLNRDYAMHINYSKDKIELLIDGVKIFSTDSLWQPPIHGGKFGFKITTGSFWGSQVFFDQLEIKELSSSVIFFKQNDPKWSNLIYDHADLWSTQPFMANWACAVSSAAMMLRVYGYGALPDGTEINPWTLNLWLMNQEDGYIAEGLVNWLAISRLSKILSDQKNNLLPKLEFNYFKGSESENLSTLQNNLEGNEVQIAAIPGHFFLVTDYLVEQNDFSIKDPLYEYDLLSLRPEKIESLRLFKPSQTDLSYLLLVLPKESIFSLTDENGENINDIKVVTEEIFSLSEKIGENYKLIYYQKPKNGQINLLLNAGNYNQEMINKIKFFFYQQNGTMQLVDLNRILDKNQDLEKVNELLFKINFSKENQSQITLEVIEKTIDEQRMAALNSAAIKSEVDFQSGKISFYLFYQLNLLIDSLREHLDYFFLLQKFLDFHQL